jgi:hypothetical protein
MDDNLPRKGEKFPVKIPTEGNWILYKKIDLAEQFLVSKDPS